MAASDEDLQNLPAVCELLKDFVKDGNFESTLLAEKFENFWGYVSNHLEKAEYQSLVLDDTLPFLVKAVLKRGDTDFDAASRFINVSLFFLFNPFNNLSRMLL